MNSTEGGEIRTFPELDLTCPPAGYSETGRLSPLNAAIYCALALHVLVDLVLLVLPWQFVDAFAVLTPVLAWPMSQNGLIAVWAATRGRSSYWRYVAVVAGAAWTWFVAIVVMPDVAIRGHVSAGWAVAFAAQSITIVLAVAAYRLLRQWNRLRMGDRLERRRLQFGVGSLLMWTTLIAATLGFGRAGFLQFGWTSGVVYWEFFVFMPVLGACSAVYALVVLFCLASREQFAVRAVLAAATIVAFGYLQLHVQQSLFGSPTALAAPATWILTGSQTAWLCATLLPLGLLRWTERARRFSSVN